ncbi:MAG: TRAFAC clade GTPase domain-containing protein [Pirellulales bacterium]
MTKRAVVAMESSRYTNYENSVPCYICDSSNNYDTELCHECSAPMALSHQAKSQGIKPDMVAVLGTAAAGKTVYLGMLLDMLTRKNNRLQLLARGVFSITLQQRTISALSNCEFPAKTPNEPDRWNWVHCQAQIPRRKQPVELVMPDMAGEAILEEIDHRQTYPVIHSFLEKCAGVILLVDTNRIEQGSQEQNYFMMKVATYLSEMDKNKKQGKSQRPLAVVFSKADQCEVCFSNPDTYARENTPNLWQQVQQRFANYGYFASGVAGACASRMEYGSGRVSVPLRIEPRGIVEPFEWLLRKM